MSSVARLVDVPAKPLELARRLSDRPGLVLLGSGFGGGACYVACDPVERSTDFDPEPELRLGGAGGPLAAVPRWVGVLPYEACRGIERRRWTRHPDHRKNPWIEQPGWLRFGAVACVTDRVLVVGDDLASVRRLERLLKRSAVSQPLTATLASSEPAGRHTERIAAALELIAAGELYQVNLARRFELAVSGPAIELFSALHRAAPAPYAAYLDLGDVVVASSSPERFLALRPNGQIITSPIKGTRPRGVDAFGDAALAAALDADPKERAELAMVLDVERNDLGRVAATGSIRLIEPPHVRTLRTVHHRFATVGGRLRNGVTRGELLGAMLPSGSVTGAPKVRAMEVIARLEAHRRGLYTGAFGALFRNGALELAMAIRTLEQRGAVARYFAGGGIVADSDPAREVEETYWKAHQLAALLGGQLQKLVQKQSDL
jgi:anthranilate/para-aminobenzoate synthase component I